MALFFTCPSWRDQCWFVWPDRWVQPEGGGPQPLESGRWTTAGQLNAIPWMAAPLWIWCFAPWVAKRWIAGDMWNKPITDHLFCFLWNTYLSNGCIGDLGSVQLPVCHGHTSKTCPQRLALWTDVCRGFQSQCRELDPRVSRFRLKTLFHIN